MGRLAQPFHIIHQYHPIRLGVDARFKAVEEDASGNDGTRHIATPPYNFIPALFHGIAIELNIYQAA